MLDTINISESTIEDLITAPTSPVQVVKKRKVYSSTNTTASWIWCHFKKLDMKKEFALCLVCDKEVYYSKNYSTSMLIRHVQRHHKQLYQEHLTSKAEEIIASEQRRNTQGFPSSSLKPFLISCPKLKKLSCKLDDCYVPAYSLL